MNQAEIRRRQIQMAYNKEHNITPKTIIKDIRDVIEISSKQKLSDSDDMKLTKAEITEKIKKLTIEMKEAAKLLEFEHAAFLRDKIKELEENLK